jgi:thiosulfate/3-mercaptopyruvate sulfurtransferase
VTDASAGPEASGRPARPLITAPALERLLDSGQGPVALLDVRWRLGGPPGIQAYLQGHLPGAVFIDLDKDLAGLPGNGGRHPLPDRAVFEAAMRAAGLHRAQLAVAYDDAGSTIAARLWWLLRYFGHDEVAVLDGGLNAWADAGLPVTTQVPRPAPGDFSAGQGGGMPVLDDAAAAGLARSGFLLDARAAERYRGETEPVDPAAGHIPGAISAPATGNVAADGTFLPRAALRERFAGLGLPLTDETAAVVAGAYCGSGVTAAQEVLALELAGLPAAALYVGSWSAWSADPARPVATGSDPG